MRIEHFMIGSHIGLQYSSVLGILTWIGTVHGAQMLK